MSKKNNSSSNTPSVSVIISMYNTQDYIGECLQSLLNQTLTNIEVIVADDCSTDNSVAVVKDIMPKFEGRLKLLKMKKNSGYPGLPRNSALKVAHGKYLYFLDSDDFIDATALEDLYKVAEEFEADVVHVEKYLEYRETEEGYKNIEKTYQKEPYVEKPTLETSDIGKRIEDLKNIRYLWWACNKLFRRKFWEESKIRFPEMTTYEDYFVTLMALTFAKNYVRVPFVSYHYRLRNSSLSHKTRDITEVIKNLAEAVYFMDSFMKESSFFTENPKQRYDMIDFYIKWRFDQSILKALFVTNEYDPIYIDSFLNERVFFNNSGKNVALTSYLFGVVAYQRMLLIGKDQQIADLKKQLEEKNNTR